MNVLAQQAGMDISTHLEKMYEESVETLRCSCWTLLCDIVLRVLANNFMRVHGI